MEPEAFKKSFEVGPYISNKLKEINSKIDVKNNKE